MIRRNFVVGSAVDRQTGWRPTAMRSVRPRALLVLGLVLAPLAPTAHAADAGEELSVHLLTLGPGDHPFFTLGESAIWIQDERAGTGVVYDFGPVKPDSTWSLITWLSGRLSNRRSRVPIQEALQTYRRANRTIDAQDLDLPPAARVAMGLVTSNDGTHAGGPGRAAPRAGAGRAPGQPRLSVRSLPE